MYPAKWELSTHFPISASPDFLIGSGQNFVAALSTSFLRPIFACLPPTFFPIGAVGSRICVALSGGVDSAVAAHLLLESGHAVEAVHMRTWQSEDGAGECPWQEDRESAQAVAEHLGIPLRIESLISLYRQHVVDPLVAGYGSGRTPNPDMLCNRFIKFGALLEGARASGCDFLATGHYCRIEHFPCGKHIIRRGVDQTKDQCYFLAAVRREALPYALFPLGGLTKKRVREIARKVGLPNAERKDSQDICFLGGKVKIQDFLGRYLPDRPGDILSGEGKILGRHRSLFRHTLGQRKGLAIPSNRDFERYVVTGKDLECNTLTVAFESDRENGLWSDSVELRDLNFLCEPILGKRRLLTEPRFRDSSVAATVHFRENGTTAHVCFEQRQRALAEGQTLAFYDGDRLLGGGTYGPRLSH
ncbi:MAG: tRNA 2-thiouridine(34) synthase MnmA [Puniceicoccales bacterium]|nr:tRNA 2-thiouridine(34) synthase MnmA [Puniceicoccales bacterium]